MFAVFMHVVVTVDADAAGERRPAGVIGFGRYTPKRTLLQTVDADGRVRSVAGGPITGFAWSPDGSRIVFSRTEGTTEESPADLYSVKDYDTGRIPRVTDNSGTVTRDLLPAWSPDRTRIAFERTDDGAASIYLVRPDGKHLEQLTRPPTVDGVQATDYFPQWSPDASKVAFVRERGELRDLYVIDRDGTNEVALTTDGRGGQGYSWAPDSQRLVLARGDSNSGEIETVRVDGSDSRVLTSGGPPKFTPRWSPDGRRIVFAQGQFPDIDLYVLDVKGGAVRQLTDERGREITPTWSQDSRFVAYNAVLDDTHTLQSPCELAIVDVESARARVVAEGMFNVFPISWQPSADGYPPAGGFQEE